MIAQVRAAALTNYFEVARFVGLDPYEMLRRAGINPLALDDPDTLLAAEAAGDLLQDSALLADCPAFGLLLAESRSLPSLGPISLLLQHEGTARDVIESMVRYRIVMNEVIVLSTEDYEGATIIRTGLSAGYRVQSIELVTGLTRRMISEAVGGGWHPDSAHFMHPAPPDLRVHRRIFQCRLVFDSDFDGLVCSSAALDAPNPSADSVMARHAQRYLEMLTPDPAGSLAERARRALYLLLPSGKASLDRLGDNLGIHPRALQRALDKEGISFATLLNQVRRELALRYLSCSAHGITQIGHMIGYASSSSFTRWFTAEFGISPAQWRADERAEEKERESGISAART